VNFVNNRPKGNRMIQLPEMPKSIAALPRDDRGYPCPWFISWIDGKPEFRVADGRKWSIAVREKRCWVCGEPIGKSRHVFVIGPMCAVNRTTAEPPCHPACAEFSAKACPFLSMPKAKRRDANMPEESQDPAGIMITCNPGVTLLWHCRGYEIFNDGSGGHLFRIPNPSQVQWFSQGRRATRDEILESIKTGVPLLEKIAAEDGPASIEHLKRSVESAMRFIPA